MHDWSAFLAGARARGGGGESSRSTELADRRLARLTSSNGQQAWVPSAYTLMRHLTLPGGRHWRYAQTERLPCCMCFLLLPVGQHFAGLAVGRELCEQLVVQLQAGGGSMQGCRGSQTAHIQHGQQTHAAVGLHLESPAGSHNPAVCWPPQHKKTK